MLTVQEKRKLYSFFYIMPKIMLAQSIRAKPRVSMTKRITSNQPCSKGYSLFLPQESTLVAAGQEQMQNRKNAVRRLEERGFWKRG